MSNPIFDDDSYYDDPKWRTPYMVGQDAFYDGTACPYEKGSEQAFEWARGWRSTDIRQQCKDDYESGERYA